MRYRVLPPSEFARPVFSGSSYCLLSRTIPSTVEVPGNHRITVLVCKIYCGLVAGIEPTLIDFRTNKPLVDLEHGVLPCTRYVKRSVAHVVVDVYLGT